ncbi:DNRLRE domain-containing protein [Paenibacillus sp. TSA_86.1]|uniref:DNRLRE domain-containing protein n=1 Tax=Paenibacillus sp. TSA_86.1 TaxID=3415649 RepID=UPI004045932B
MAELMKISGVDEYFNSVIYVEGATGNDTTGNGSASLPYKTVQKAVSVAVTGDAVYAKAGTYNAMSNLDAGGLDDQNKGITFVGDAGKTIFNIDGRTTSVRDVHAISFGHIDSKVYNVIFDVNFGSRTTNYNKALFSRMISTSMPVKGKAINCVFKTNAMPSMVYDNTETSSFEINNCTFLTPTGALLGSYSGGTKYVVNNGAFTANAAPENTSAYTSCSFGQTIDETNYSSVKTGTGVYSGKYAWEVVLGTAYSFVANGTLRNGTVQNWTVPADGVYRIQALGAQGGHGNQSATPVGKLGGLGASMAGSFTLYVGEVINVVVGQKGQDGFGNANCGGAGGGGSFVYKGAIGGNSLLIAAGGGGGGAGGSQTNGERVHGTFSMNGQQGGSAPLPSTTLAGLGGTDGNGGYSITDYNTDYQGGGGAGWLSDGESGAKVNGNGGKRFTGGKFAAAEGGFGGGGGSGDVRTNYSHGAGGGGGYSGGSGVYYSAGNGGGGGSYNSGTSQTNISGTNSSDGSVTITYLGSLNSKYDTDSYLEVTLRNTMPSSITVLREDQSQIDGSITPRSSLEGDIPSSIDIPRHEHIISQISVTENNTMDGTSFIWGVRDSDLESILAVPSHSYLPSKISVTENNTMDATSFIWGVREADLVSKISIKRMDDSYLKSKIAVRELNTMEGTVDIFGRGTEEIGGSIFAMGISESAIDCRIGVRLRNSMTGQTDIWGTGDSDVTSEVNVNQVSDLPMTLGVTPSNRMTAIVDIQQPTRVTDTLNAKRDAFIREAYPKLNYGGEQTLVAGYSASRTEIFRSLVGFDITNILGMSNDYKIEKVSMKLKHSIGRTPTHPLELRAVTGDWTELGVTWNNQPNAGDVVSQEGFTADVEKGFITFNITDYILQAKVEGKNIVDFYVRAVNEADESSQFFSMDAGVSLAPSIEYTYFDEVIRSTGRSGIDTSILVMYPRTKNLSSKINVFKKSDKNDLSSKITVTPSGNRFENLPSRLMISRPNLQGKGIIRVGTWSDLTSEVAVREADLNDLENCSIMVSRPNLKQTLYIANRKDTPSKLSVRVWGEDNLYGWAIVTVKERPATIYIRPYIDKVGTIKVMRTVDEDLTGQFIVSERNKLGTIEVLNRSDLDSVMIARGGENTDIASSIIANQYQLLGTIEVNPYIDYKGSISVRHTNDNTKESSITVSRPDLNSSVYVRFRSDWDGIVTVRRTDRSEIIGQTAVSRPDLKGLIFPIIHNDITGSITVRRTVMKELKSKIIVPFRKDILAEMDIVGASMLPSSIRVNSEYLFSTIEVPAYGNGDIHGEFTVRVRMASDLDSAIEIVQYDTIDGNIIVRQFFEKSIKSKITVKRTQNEELTGKVRVWIVRNLNGRISVRRETQSNIHSSMFILWQDDLQGSVIIPSRADLTSRIKVMYPAQSEILSKILAKIRVHSDLESEIDVVKGGAGDLLSIMGVTPTNKMTGIVDITLPIREEVVLDIVRDAYVREDVPTLNYGEETTFAVGSYRDKVLRSLLGFDISSLKASYDFDKVELRMIYGQVPTKNLKLFAVNGNWSETGVTWNNRPNIGTEISNSYKVDTEEGYVTFDVTDFIEQQYTVGNHLVDFYLVAFNEFEPNYEYFFSKESSLIPQLVVTYFDPAVWSFGRSNIDSSVRVSSRKNLSSRIRVRKPAWLEVGITASIEVTRNNEFKGVANVSRPDMLSSITTMYRDQLDISSSLGVSNKSLSKIDGEMVVSKPDLPISFYVKNRVNLPSTVGVRVWTEQDFFSWLIVNVKERPASLTVLSHNDVELRLTVRGENTENLTTPLTVSRPNLGGSITAKLSENGELPSRITVRHNVEYHVEGRIKVIVRVNRDLYSEVMVLSVGQADIPSALVVVGYSLCSALYVSNTEVLPSKLMVNSTWFEYLPVTFEVSRPDLPSRVEVTLSSDIDASITVNAFGQDELATDIAVSREILQSSIKVSDRLDVTSTVEVKVDTVQSLGSDLIVNRPELAGVVNVVLNKDLRSTINVMFKDSEDLGSKVFVKYMNDIVAILDVVGASMIPSSIQVISGNLASVIAVPAYGNKNLEGTIGVKNRFISEIPTTLQVQEWSQFVATIGVRNWADHDVGGSMTVVRHGFSDLVSVIVPVMRYTIPSTIGVRFDNTMTGHVDFVPVGQTDIDGRIEISPASDIVGSLQVVLKAEYNIPSSLKVRAKGEIDLSANVSIVYRKNNDLLTTIGVPALNKMTGKVFIIPVADEDLDSSIYVLFSTNLNSKLAVRRSSMSEKTCKVTVRRRDNSDIGGSINTIQWRVLNSKITVRRSALSEIPMRLEVLEKSDLLNCTITLRRTEIADLKATITIRRSAVKDLNGRIVARRSDKSDLPSFIETWQFRTVPSKIYVLYRNDLISTIDVVADYGYCFIM